MSKLSNDYSGLSDRTSQWLDSGNAMLVGKDWVQAQSGETLQVYDPSTGAPFAQVPAAGQADVDQAVKAARAAFETGPWARMKPVERERLMLRLADLLSEQGQSFAELEVVNSGRLLGATRAIDVDFSVDCLRYMAGWATKIEGRTANLSTPYLPDSKFLGFTTKEPVGVVAAITPWNVPLSQAIWKIAPVLATGCCVVLKPAEQTPLTSLRFAQMALDAGIPPGVINVVTGTGRDAGAALVAHPGVDKISFTGSTQTGRAIATAAASQFKKVSLELGGKSPMIVFDDADLDLVIPGVAWGIFGNHGQNCCAGSRLYVQEKVYDQVMAGVAEIARSINLGHGLDPDSQMGPLISADQKAKVNAYIESGVEQGAELLSGGNAIDHAGYYVEPVVFANVTADMRIVREEIFGPVLAAASFKTEDEALGLANATTFGLGASVWSNDINRVHRLSARLEAGSIWVNNHNTLDLAMPFGGFKDSGIGQELGEAAIDQHVRTKAHFHAIHR